MTVFKAMPIHSSLPNLPLTNKCSDEIKEPSGFWYGFSHYQRKSDLIRVSHVKRLERNGWDSSLEPSRVLSRQVICVTAYVGEEKVGDARFRLYDVEDGGLKHAGIWCSSTTQVEEKWQRRGVSSAMYAHMRAFGYPLSPARVLSFEAQEMWKFFDPNISFIETYFDNEIVSIATNNTIQDVDWESEAKAVLKEFKKELGPSFKDWLEVCLADQNEQEKVSKILYYLGSFFVYPELALRKLVANFQTGYMWNKKDFAKNFNWFGEHFMSQYYWMRMISPKFNELYHFIGEHICPLSEDFSDVYYAFKEERRNAYLQHYEYWMGHKPLNR